MSTAEKRVLETPKSWADKSVVILDIEGTTTAISFVKDTLFPYVRSNVEKYIKDHWADDEFKTVLAQLIEQSEKDVADKVEGVIELKKDEADDEKAQQAVTANVLWQMDGDRKTKALKMLQGHIYRDGYKNGDLKGHVFSDVAPTLKKWKEANKQIYIYSSGSVEAQKLLFENSTEGDLLKFLSGHFDTEVGAKQETMSYTNILNKIEKKPEEAVFFTDVFKEAEAAKEAGMIAVLVERDGNTELSSEERAKHPVVKDLDFFEEEEGAGPVKRMKVDAEDDIEMKEAESEKKEEKEEETKEKSTVEEMQTETAEEKIEKVGTAEGDKIEKGDKAEKGAKVEEGDKAEEGAASDKETPAVAEEPAAKESESEKKSDDLPKPEGESSSDPKEDKKDKSTAAVEENKTLEALEAPPKVDAIEHKPDAPESEKAVEPTTNGTTHENGTSVNGNGTNGIATNGVSKETNGNTNGTEECQPKEEAGEKVSPVKKVVTESAADGKEATECAE